MKIKRIVAAVMALVLVGGAYPLNTANTRNIGKTYAAESGAEEFVSDGIRYIVKKNAVSVKALEDKSMKEVVIPAEVNGYPVTYIEYGAFKGTGIKKVTIGENVETIWIYAFSNCQSLEEVTFNDKLKDIGPDAFERTRIKKIVLGENVESIDSSAFADCSELTEVVLNDKLTRIDSSAFMNCKYLSKITGGSNIEYIGNQAFDNCPLITSFDLGDKLTYIGDSAFARTGIKEIVIPEGIKKLYDCPIGISPVTTYEPSLGASGTVIIKNPECELLVYSLNNKTNWDKCLIVCDEESKAHAFAEEHGIRFCTPEQYESGDYEKIDASEEELEDAVSKYGMKFEKCEGGLEVTYIDRAENGTVTIPDEVAGLPVVKCDLGNPQRISTSFANDVCPKIEKIVIGKNVKYIGDMCFVRCPFVKSVEGCENVETIGSSAFASLTKMESFSFGSKLRTIGNTAFTSCSSLNGLVFPDTLESIGDSAFAGCVGVKSISFGNGLKVIGRSCFGGVGCESIETPESLETIGDSAFCQCYSLKNVKLNEGLKEICEGAFSDCIYLREVNIPSTVTVLNDKVFNNTNISKLVIPESVAEIGKNAFCFISGEYTRKGLKQTYEVPDADTVEVWIYDPQCVIDADAFTRVDTLYGYKDSTAEAYIKEQSEGSFKLINEAETEAEEPSFTVEKETYKDGEPIVVTIKNVDPDSLLFTEENLRRIDKVEAEDGSVIVRFKSVKSGEAGVKISYGYDGKMREKELHFNILEEEYEDENSPKFVVAKETYKDGEPIVVTIKNVDPDSLLFTEENLRRIDKVEAEDGSVIVRFKSVKSGEAGVKISYGYDGKMREKELHFTILEEEYEDENSPKFEAEKETYKDGEPIVVTIKNVDPDSLLFTEENLRRIDKVEAEDGSVVVRFKSVKSGEAGVKISYGYDGKMREKELHFNILEEEYEDENSPKFEAEKEIYKNGEPIVVTIKNVDPDSLLFTEENLRRIDKVEAEDGSVVVRFKSVKSGEAGVKISYGYDGKMREKELHFNILEEEYEDENSPKFEVEKETYKDGEPIVVTIKNVEPDSLLFTEENLRRIDKVEAEDGSVVVRFKSVKSGEAGVKISYGYDGKMREKELHFNILEEEYEDENSPKFEAEKETYKDGEPIVVTIKNVDSDSLLFTEENLRRIDKVEVEDGSVVVRFKSVNSGEAGVKISYGFDGKMREKELHFNILEEKYDEEETPADVIKGDANCDGTVDMSDVVLIMQSLANPNKYGVSGTHENHLTQQGSENSDVDTEVKGLTVGDALKIQKFLLGKEKTL